eukprot:53930-Amphidinium_carterae.5
MGTYTNQQNETSSTTAGASCKPNKQSKGMLDSLTSCPGRAGISIPPVFLSPSDKHALRAAKQNKARITATQDAHARWLSQGTPRSSQEKTAEGANARHKGHSQTHQKFGHESKQRQPSSLKRGRTANPQPN